MLPIYMRPPYRAAGDRVYQAIKARLIAYEFPQGRRIYLEPVANALGVSTTPVREAMNRLAERDLVVKAENKGFYAMTLAEARVRGYYELTRLLLVVGLDILPSTATEQMRRDPWSTQILARLNRHTITDAGALAKYTGEVFAAIAAIAGNDATRHAVELANDHLYYVRTIECRYLGDVQTVLRHLCELILSGNHGELAAAIDAYHERRLELLPVLLQTATSGT